MLVNIIIVTILVLLSGIFAGLTLALFSLRLTSLEAKVRTGNRQAEKVYRIRKKGNLLLCTLLLGNVASYTVMAIFLGSITTGVVAGFVATALIFVFGEILPQALFPRHALELGAKFYWLVWILLVLFYPISAPIAWLLDRIIGKEAPVLWSKEELSELVKIHEDEGDGVIDKDEERIILGALTFSDIRVSDIMIPQDEVFYLEPNEVVDQHVIEKVKARGFGRIPIYNKINRRIEGILYAKNLLGVSPGKRASELCDTSRLIIVYEDHKLDNLLNLLIDRKLHMALVVNEEGDFAGVATLEDIMEEILRIEIEDMKQ